MKALWYLLFKGRMHKESCTLKMRTENKKTQTLQDFKVQGSNLDLKYSGPYANINITEALCSLATLLYNFFWSEQEKQTQSKLPQLSIPLVFNFLLPHVPAVFILSYLVADLQSQLQSANSEPDRNKKHL